MKKMLVLFALIVSLGYSQTRPSICPVSDFEGETSEFGKRLHPILKIERDHNAIDFFVPLGTPVLASADGKVIQAETIQGYGLVVRIQHGKPFRTFYAHLSELAVKPGQRIKKGQVIAYSGNSGLSSEPHLHYEVLQNGKNVNPRDFIAQR